MRTPLVAMLIAVEIVLVGLMLYAVKGGHQGWVSAHESGFPAHELSFHNVPIAPLAVGSSPVVSVDDPDATVTVDVSSDGQVHVQDLSSVSGFVWGHYDIPPLHMTRTGDGVSITRAAAVNDMRMQLGDVNEEIRVDVPSDSRLAIGHCSGADVSGIAGGVDVASQDGHISLRGLRGDVTAHSEDGRIEADDLNGGRVNLSTEDGRLLLSNITTASLDANTEDGSVHAAHLAISGSDAHAVVHTDDGSVSAQLAAGSNATVVASTGDGSITIDGNSYSGDDSVERTVQVGDGSAKMRISSGDGSIHLTTNGAQ